VVDKEREREPGHLSTARTSILRVALPLERLCLRRTNNSSHSRRRPPSEAIVDYILSSLPYYTTLENQPNSYKYS
jgi:hypothetical protein